jgi:hypothetical protein
MTRWFVGVKHNGQREVFAESAGTNPTAESKGYTEVCGPYHSQGDATKAAKGKASVHGGSLQNRRKGKGK